MEHIINELDIKLNNRNLAPNKYDIVVSPELEEYITDNNLESGLGIGVIYYNQFQIRVDRSYKEEEFQIVRK